ncbi:hypothetical protein MVEN_01755900 [Mycena venus]|uniref:Uncharacterized protein n=1 Tax=Mycena venus TaxID=2733690 RepID=A0A8H7CPY4_9AGAR|nr:hypothetical protein MVEN_01755900 [Mycena venus]
MKFSTTVILAVSMAVSAAPVPQPLFPAGLADKISSLLANLPAPTPAPTPIDLGDISFGHLPELPPRQLEGVLGQVLHSIFENQPAPTPAPTPIDLGDISFGHLPELPPRQLPAVIADKLSSLLANLPAPTPAPTPTPIDLGDLPIGHLPELPANGVPFDPNTVPAPPPARRLDFPQVIADKLPTLFQPAPAPTPDAGVSRRGHPHRPPPPSCFRGRGATFSYDSILVGYFAELPTPVDDPAIAPSKTEILPNAPVKTRLPDAGGAVPDVPAPFKTGIVF